VVVVCCIIIGVMMCCVGLTQCDCTTEQNNVSVVLVFMILQFMSLIPEFSEIMWYGAFPLDAGRPTMLEREFFHLYVYLQI
jgi:hypothetical protein